MTYFSKLISQSAYRPYTSAQVGLAIIKLRKVQCGLNAWSPL